MPFPNYHAYRVKDPALFIEGSFRTMEFEHNSKPYSVIMGKLKDGGDSMVVQTYRYPREKWTAAQAKTHAVAHEKSGSFEAAKADESLPDERIDSDVSRSSFCRLDTSWVKNDEGYIDALVYPTRVGVFPYWDSKQKKVVYEYRSPEQVFALDSMRTLEGKDLTNDHPSNMVKSSSFKALSVGSLYGKHEKAPDGIHTQSRVMVKEDGAIKAVEGGKNQVSCGYKCDLLNVPGVWVDPQGKSWHYDRQQVNIRYNHLALVDRGRMGPEARLRADSLGNGERYDAYEIELESEGETQGMTAEEMAAMMAENKKLKEQMKGTDKKMDEDTIKIDGKEVITTKVGAVLMENKMNADAAEIKKQADRADAAEKEATQFKNDLAALQAKYDTQTAELEAAKKIDVGALVKERASLIATANKIAKNDKYDSMTDRQIKEYAITQAFPGTTFTGKNNNDIYVDGMFDGASKVKRDGSSVVGAYNGATNRGDSGNTDTDIVNLDRYPGEDE